MSTNKAVFFLIMCFALIFTAGSAYAAVEQLSSKWTASVDDDIKALGTGDIDGDNVSEIIAADSRKVYVFNVEGRQIRTYPINFTASVIYVADIDGDGLNEILIGGGYMETKNLSVERFDLVVRAFHSPIVDRMRPPIQDASPMHLESLGHLL